MFVGLKNLNESFGKPDESFRTYETIQEIIDAMEEAEDYDDLYNIAAEIENEQLRTDVEKAIAVCERDEDPIDQAYSMVTTDNLDPLWLQMNDVDLSDDSDMWEVDESLNEAADQVKLYVEFEPYERYDRVGMLKGRVSGADELEALKKLVDKLNLYIDSDEIDEYVEEGETFEDIIEGIKSSNGDGCDFILTLINETTGKTYIDEIGSGFVFDEDFNDDDIDDSETYIVQAFTAKYLPGEDDWNLDVDDDEYLEANWDKVFEKEYPTLEAAEKAGQEVARRNSDVYGNNFVRIIDEYGDLWDQFSGTYDSDAIPQFDDLLDEAKLEKCSDDDCENPISAYLADAESCDDEKFYTSNNPWDAPGMSTRDFVDFPIRESWSEDGYADDTEFYSAVDKVIHNIKKNHITDRDELIRELSGLSKNTIKDILANIRLPREDDTYIKNRLVYNESLIDMEPRKINLKDYGDGFVEFRDGSPINVYTDYSYAASGVYWSGRGDAEYDLGTHDYTIMQWKDGKLIPVKGWTPINNISEYNLTEATARDKRKEFKSQLADKIRKNELEPTDVERSEYMGWNPPLEAEAGDYQIQFQDRQNNTHEYKGVTDDNGRIIGMGRKLNKQPKTKSQTWGRVWKDGELKKQFNGSKYEVRQDMANYLDGKMITEGVTEETLDIYRKVVAEIEDLCLNKVESNLAIDLVKLGYNPDWMPNDRQDTSRLDAKVDAAVGNYARALADLLFMNADK